MGIKVGTAPRSASEGTKQVIAMMVIEMAGACDFFRENVSYRMTLTQ
jgi:hypothetical protein